MGKEEQKNNIDKIISKYPDMIMKGNGWIIFDGSASKTLNKLHVDGWEEEIKDIEYIVEHSDCHIKLVNYTVIEANKVFTIKNINKIKKIEIENFKVPAIIENVSDLSISSSTIKTLKVNEEFNNINISNTNINDVSIDVEVEKKKQFFIPQGLINFNDGFSAFLLNRHVS